MPILRCTLIILLSSFSLSLFAGADKNIQALVAACKTTKSPQSALVLSGPDGFRTGIDTATSSLRYVVGKQSEDAFNPTTEQAVWDTQTNKVTDFRSLYKGTPFSPTVRAVSEKSSTAVVIETTRMNYQAPYNISLHNLNDGKKSSLSATLDWVHGRTTLSENESKLLVVPSVKYLNEVTVVDLNSRKKTETKYQLDLPNGKNGGILEPSIDNSGSLITARLTQSEKSDHETIVWQLGASVAPSKKNGSTKTLIPSLDKARSTSDSSKDERKHYTILEGMPLGTSPDGKWIVTKNKKEKVVSLYENTPNGIIEVPLKGSSELYDNLKELNDLKGNVFTPFGAKEVQITNEGYLVLRLGRTEQQITMLPNGGGVGGPSIEHTLFARWHLDHPEKPPEVFEVPLTGRGELVHKITYKLGSDGRILAAGINPKGLYFWEADSGKMIQVPRKNPNAKGWSELHGELKFSEDGSKLMISTMTDVEVVDLINIFKQQNKTSQNLLALPPPKVQ